MLKYIYMASNAEGTKPRWRRRLGWIIGLLILLGGLWYYRANNHGALHPVSRLPSRYQLVWDDTRQLLIIQQKRTNRGPLQILTFPGEKHRFIAPWNANRTARFLPLRTPDNQYLYVFDRMTKRHSLVMFLFTDEPKDRQLMAKQGFNLDFPQQGNRFVAVNTNYNRQINIDYRGFNGGGYSFRPDATVFQNGSACANSFMADSPWQASSDGTLWYRSNDGGSFSILKWRSGTPRLLQVPFPQQFSWGNPVFPAIDVRKDGHMIAYAVSDENRITLRIINLIKYKTGWHIPRSSRLRRRLVLQRDGKQIGSDTQILSIPHLAGTTPGGQVYFYENVAFSPDGHYLCWQIRTIDTLKKERVISTRIYEIR